MTCHVAGRDSSLERVRGRKKAAHTAAAAILSYRGLYQFFLLQQFHSMWAVIVARGKKWRRRPIASLQIRSDENGRAGWLVTIRNLIAPLANRTVGEIQSRERMLPSLPFTDRSADGWNRDRD